MRSLVQVHDETFTLYGRLQKKYFLKADLGEELVNWIMQIFDGSYSRFSIKSKLESAVTAIEIKHTGARINLYQGAKDIMRLVPVAMYRDDKTRMNAISYVQELLDEAIDQEIDEEDYEEDC